MIFTELNNGQTENLFQISYIDKQGTDIIYYPAKGSLTEHREHFSTEAEAEERYEFLKKKLVKT